MSSNHPDWFTWKNRVNAAVAVSPPPPQRLGHEKILFRTTAAAFIRTAADVRGVAVAGFARRATLAMTAQVLEMDWADLIEADPTIQLAGDYFPAPDPSGRIGGPWEILALK